MVGPLIEDRPAMSFEIMPEEIEGYVMIYTVTIFGMKAGESKYESKHPGVLKLTRIGLGFSVDSSTASSAASKYEDEQKSAR